MKIFRFVCSRVRIDVGMETVAFVLNTRFMMLLGAMIHMLWIELKLHSNYAVCQEWRRTLYCLVRKKVEPCKSLTLLWIFLLMIQDCLQAKDNSH